ncbi:MAG TPA: hypothetical protein VM779_08215 [Thermoanaerobaculia bacterium]|nr:hypothetical protein [Thermoanaerobaculia bacterium]
MSGAPNMDHQYRLAIDGDGEERAAWVEFVSSEFPEYELFWLASVVPLTRRPMGVSLRSDGELPVGRSAEDVAVAQLHYTVLKNLRRAHASRSAPQVDDYFLTLGLSFLVAAQDVAFEILQRRTSPGVYDPWKESEPPGQKRSNNCGQSARKAWQKANGYPLAWVRDYRNKLLHGRTPPALNGMLPKPEVLTRYADWRTAGSELALVDFESPRDILHRAWHETISYFRESWRSVLLPERSGA